MNSQRTAETVVRIVESAAQELVKVQDRITDAFAAGEMVLPGTLESLIEAQADANVTASLQTRWNRAGSKAIEEWLDEAAETLIETNVGGSTSMVQNAREAAERKAMQKAYRALNRCR